MAGNKRDMAQDWTDPDDVPDLTAPEWSDKLNTTPVRRGRPVSPSPKVWTTIRLDPQVLEYFKATGPGRQTRINDALRKAAGL
jgi:uncharacterized protein (DUF4415 family)